MTPAEDIAYLRERLALSSTNTAAKVLAVCDLAERALLTDEQIDAEVVARLTETERAGWDVAERLAAQFRLTDDETEHVRLYEESGGEYHLPHVVALTVFRVLRRLLGAQPAPKQEHRYLASGDKVALCECGWNHHRERPDPDAAVRAWVAHAQAEGAL